MNYNQLVVKLNTLGVSPPDVCRASLYLDYLESAHSYFRNTMCTDLGDLGYNFVRRAVCSANLLNELSAIFDLYIGRAVKEEYERVAKPKNWNYQQFFEEQILAKFYKDNVNTFRNRYKLSTYALKKIYTNFTENIFLVCKRVIADTITNPILERFYADKYKPGFKIQFLKKIKSTGSDFHKGGKQVLILTFSVSHGKLQSLFSYEDLKVVYKPSDIEIDCLIAGDSAAVNRVIPGFMPENGSLFEIYNAALADYNQANRDFTGESLNTYRFLPRNYLSVHTHDAKSRIPIQKAYGYEEYLSNDVSMTPQHYFGHNPFDTSDYLIFWTIDENQIVRKFYHKMGAFCALACTFSILDMHIENIRVHKYLPYPIDLEVSLTKAVDSIIDTVLIHGASYVGENIGGINGYYYEPSDIEWEIKEGNLKLNYSPKVYQNRLWRVKSNSQKELIQVPVDTLIDGFNEGMEILKAAQGRSRFDDWWIRLNNCVVRYIPYKTADFQHIRDALFFRVETQKLAFNKIQQKILREELLIKYRSYEDGAKGANPNFLVMTQSQSGEDYKNLDIPIFYHRITTDEPWNLNIYNSRGEQVPIPTIILIKNENPPPATIRVDVAPDPKAKDATHTTHLGRNTFFAQAPTQNNVRIGQVQELTGDEFDVRVNALRESINEGLQGRYNPTAIISIHT